MAFTRFEHVVTGIGENASEAYADAVEMIWTDADAHPLPKRPRGIRARDRVPAECMGEDSEVWWRVSIRYNVKESPPVAHCRRCGQRPGQPGNNGICDACMCG